MKKLSTRFHFVNGIKVLLYLMKSRLFFIFQNIGFAVTMQKE